jgi:hypothetical protein
MTRSKPFTWIAAAIFALMAVVHVLRLFTHFQILIGSHSIPEWVSGVAALFTAFMSWMLCRGARGTTGP